MRGSRVQAVVGELQGEKIDIIPWSQDPATFVVNGLAPAEVTKVVMDEEQRRIEVVVPDEQLSLAIGRRGQNVRLASQLTGWDIDILTEAEESERRTEEFRTRSQLFIDALDIDDVIAHLLVTEGFTSLEEVAYVATADLAEIEGFDEDIATELQERARNALERRDQEYEERYRALGVADELVAIEGLTPGMLVTLGENDIKTVDDFAGLAGDELLEMLAASDKGGAKLEEDEANAMIMSARAAAGWLRSSRGRAGGERVSAAPAQVSAPEPATHRRCIATGELHERGTLLRFVVAPGRRSRARYGRPPARTGFVVDAAPGYSGAGGGEAVVCACGAAAGNDTVGTCRSRRGVVSATMLRRVGPRTAGRPCGRRVRAGNRDGAARQGRSSGLRARRSGKRSRQGGGGRARIAGGDRVDGGGAGRGVWP